MSVCVRVLRARVRCARASGNNGGRSAPLSPRAASPSKTNSPKEKSSSLSFFQRHVNKLASKARPSACASQCAGGVAALQRCGAATLTPRRRRGFSRAPPAEKTADFSTAESLATSLQQSTLGSADLIRLGRHAPAARSRCFFLPSRPSQRRRDARQLSKVAQTRVVRRVHSEGRRAVAAAIHAQFQEDVERVRALRSFVWSRSFVSLAPQRTGAAATNCARSFCASARSFCSKC